MKISHLTHILTLFTFLLAPLSSLAQSADKWLPQREKEYLVRKSGSLLDMDTRYEYDSKGHVILRYAKTEGCEDSIRYCYDEWGQNIYEADYRGYQSDSLIFYTYDNRAYDPIIHDLCVLRKGYQNVDQEWTVYKAEKIIITRDDNNNILRIGDYTPGEDGQPDIPISYVKNFTYEGNRPLTYTRETYNMDPVTEEAYLKLEEKWTDMKWESCSGQVLDPNECFHGTNRLKSATVYDDYSGYTYALNVTYGGAHPDDYVATMDIPGANLRKVHSLTFTDANGSFIEEFRTYRTAEGKADQLSSIERVTEEYDTHGNKVLFERALTSDPEHPETVSVRQGNKYEYTYNATYDDWTICVEYIFNQSYDPGVDGEYEAYARIERSEWGLLGTIGIQPPHTTAASLPSRPCYDLTGRPATARSRGIIITPAGKKVLR